MAAETLLEGKVLWSYDYEIEKFYKTEHTVYPIPQLKDPLHHHQGKIYLTKDALIIEGDDGDEELGIRISSIRELHLGHDEIYTINSVKNFGLFWQPLKIEYIAYEDHQKRIYLIVDYKSFYTRNYKWYDTLVEMTKGSNIV